MGQGVCSPDSDDGLFPKRSISSLTTRRNSSSCGSFAELLEDSDSELEDNAEMESLSAGEESQTRRLRKRKGSPASRRTSMRSSSLISNISLLSDQSELWDTPHNAEQPDLDTPHNVEQPAAKKARQNMQYLERDLTDTLAKWCGLSVDWSTNNVVPAIVREQQLAMGHKSRTEGQQSSGPEEYFEESPGKPVPAPSRYSHLPLADVFAEACYKSLNL